MDRSALFSGTFEATLRVVAEVFAAVGPDEKATAAMLDVLGAFAEEAENRGTDSWADVAAADAHGFIQDPEVDLEARRLAKNAIHGAYLALASVGLYEGDHFPAYGVYPDPATVRAHIGGRHRFKHTAQGAYAEDSDHFPLRPATHDEVTVLRLAGMLVRTSRSEHRCEACVAVCSAGASTGEFGGILVRGHSEQADTLALPGLDNPVREKRIKRRTVELDPWNARALVDWRREAHDGGRTSGRSPLLYQGPKRSDPVVPAACAIQQVNKARVIADLHVDPQLTAGSLRLWGGVRLADGTPNGLARAAEVLGWNVSTLYRRALQLGDRALR